MRVTSPVPWLTLMVVLAGCAAQEQTPVPAVPAPEPANPALGLPETPVPAPDVMGWVPETLSPSVQNRVQDISKPWGDLDNPVVVIKDGRYYPYYVHVKLGGSVTWINQDRVTQSVTSPIPGGATQEGYWEGVLAPGESYTKSFQRYTGTFTYHSTYTQDLRGNVIVVGDRR